VQLSRCEVKAREIFPLGQPLEDTPWLGLRPATPDMKPVIGEAPGLPGLWLAFGHAHHGLTLGPATGRLLAEMMTGEAPFADPRPFDMRRFI
jgi:D-amino-acid dehydrogenase